LNVLYVSLATMGGLLLLLGALLKERTPVSEPLRVSTTPLTKLYGRLPAD
jgi:hypothetical protein